jgi:hypothetical protein
MFATVSVKLTLPVLAELAAKSEHSSNPEQLSDVIAAAVDFWLARHEALSGAPEPVLRGYQWKSLFLPEGTMLRSWSYGEHRYAIVEGDRIMHEGVAVSPNQFARSFARTTRNAWTDLSVRRPGDKTYQVASLLRRQIAREKQTEPSINPAAATESPATNKPAASPPVKYWDIPERRTMRYRLEDVAFE